MEYRIKIDESSQVEKYYAKKNKYMDGQMDIVVLMITIFVIAFIFTGIKTFFESIREGKKREFNEKQLADHWNNIDEHLEKLSKKNSEDLPPH